MQPEIDNDTITPSTVAVSQKNTEEIKVTVILFNFTYFYSKHRHDYRTARRQPVFPQARMFSSNNKIVFFLSIVVAVKQK